MDEQMKLLLKIASALNLVKVQNELKMQIKKSVPESSERYIKAEFFGFAVVVYVGTKDNCFKVAIKELETDTFVRDYGEIEGEEKVVFFVMRWYKHLEEIESMFNVTFE